MASAGFSPLPELRTERLFLRKLLKEDAREIFALRSDEAVNRFLDRDKARIMADAQGFIERINRSIDQAESFYWAISFRDRPPLIGTICLFGFSQNHQEAEIGFELLPEFQGLGVMQEAIQKVIGFSFGELKLLRLRACTHPENSPSIRLLEKNNFTRQVDITSQGDSLMREFSLDSPLQDATKI
jgi:[ribosomal protein S5]-alanine N-acetyltransferase